jgi:antitoxin component of MazEF toxin-antitoxin module
MKLKIKVANWSGMYVIRLPKSIAENEGIKPGMTVEVTVGVVKEKQEA